MSAPRTSVWSRFLSQPLGVVAAAILSVIVVASIAAPLLSPWDPNALDLANTVSGSSPEHLLGTDRTGRDVLSRLLWGGQVSLAGALLAVAVALIIGVPTGLLAGFHGKLTDSVLNWFNSLLLAIPAIILLLAVRAAFGPSIWLSMTVFGVMLAPSFFLLVRNSVRVIRRELFIDAAKVAGLTTRRIIGHHVLRSVTAPILIQAAFVTGTAIGIQAALEFVGVGDASVPSWGFLLNEAFLNMYINPVGLLWPSAVLALTCASLVILANSLRDALESTDRRHRRRAAAGVITATSAHAVHSDEPTYADPVSEDAHRLLSIQDLRVGYRVGTPDAVEVVHGVSLDVHVGEILGLIGESGSGKSQTAFAALGLLATGGSVTEGRVLLGEKDLTKLTPAQWRRIRGARIGYVPQEPLSNLDPVYTVGSQLVAGMRTHLSLTRKQARERALDLLRQVGIRDPQRTFDSYPHQISGGMAQRVLIAGAISCDPEILIADEPTTALDVTVQAEILDLIRRLQQERGLGVLLVTHSLGVVADICDRVAVMRAGRVVEVATSRKIFSSPRHSYTRTLLDSVMESRPLRGIQPPQVEGAVQ